jgi:hypothetical protein
LKVHRGLAGRQGKSSTIEPARVVLGRIRLHTALLGAGKCWAVPRAGQSRRAYSSYAARRVCRAALLTPRYFNERRAMGVGLPAARSALVQLRTGQVSLDPCDLCSWCYRAAVSAGRQAANRVPESQASISPPLCSAVPFQRIRVARPAAPIRPRDLRTRFA